MCDTMVALGNSTADGSVIFAKNSDREPNEDQELVYLPAAVHDADEMTKCTFTEIPQARETLAAIFSKPFWMFGCEMGANEAGVVMGNEAVFTKERYEKAGLTGMDLKRLALERSDTAHKALYTIIYLMEKHGQCAMGGYRHTLKYHNSFIIADSGEAYVLETAGRHWIVEKVRDVRSISNGLTIGANGMTPRRILSITPSNVVGANRGTNSTSRTAIVSNSSHSSAPASNGTPAPVRAWKTMLAASRHNSWPACCAIMGRPATTRAGRRIRGCS